MADNVLVIHGGGPTAVINSSLYGIIEEAKESGQIGKVYGAMGGSGAIFKENFLDLLTVPEEKLKLLLQTPATAIGSSRYALEQEDYEAMVPIFKKYQIKYVLLNGGNGTMDTCGKIFAVCKDQGIQVVGIPKTIDNDIAITDHTPGFGSAARYIAATTAEVGVDVKSLPIHVCIIEAMGRNAGWITAASALARKKPGDAPHLIYLPERPFHEEEFLEDVQKLYEEKGGVVVVASEGLKNEAGEPIVPPIFKSGRATYYGDVSAHLANLVIQKLGIKARSEKPGICGRASIAWQSPVDRDEAVIAGREGLKAA
ncbi:MAG: diphosphate--fructose-6-phosphate 1-phosphotransferase, partial [Hungatella sp.]